MFPASRIDQKLCEYSAQRNQVGFDHPPHQAVVHAGVAVDQYVAKRHDARQLSDGCCGLRVCALQLIQGFANDFELTLDCGAQVVILRCTRRKFCPW